MRYCSRVRGDQGPNSSRTKFTLMVASYQLACSSPNGRHLLFNASWRVNYFTLMFPCFVCKAVHYCHGLFSQNRWQNKGMLVGIGRKLASCEKSLQRLTAQLIIQIYSTKEASKTEVLLLLHPRKKRWHGIRGWLRRAMYSKFLRAYNT